MLRCTANLESWRKRGMRSGRRIFSWISAIELGKIRWGLNSVTLHVQKPSGYTETAGHSMLLKNVLMHKSHRKFATCNITNV